MKELIDYAVQADVMRKVMKGVVVEEAPDGSTISYKKPRSKPVTIARPDNNTMLLQLYGFMVMQGYVLVPSPDGKVHLCGGGSSTYSVTLGSCTCPAAIYGGGSCKHMRMLQGYEVYRRKAIALRKTALQE